MGLWPEISCSNQNCKKRVFPWHQWNHDSPHANLQPKPHKVQKVKLAWGRNDSGGENMLHCLSITSTELIDSRWRMRKSNVNTAIGALLWQASRPAQLFKSCGTSVLYNMCMWWGTTGGCSSPSSGFWSSQVEQIIVCMYVCIYVWISDTLNSV